MTARDDGAAEVGRDVGEDLDGDDEADGDADEGEEDAQGKPEEEDEGHERCRLAHQAAVVEDDRAERGTFRLLRHVVVHEKRCQELLLHGCI